MLLFIKIEIYGIQVIISMKILITKKNLKNTLKLILEDYQLKMIVKYQTYNH